MPLSLDPRQLLAPPHDSAHAIDAATLAPYRDRAVAALAELVAAPPGFWECLDDDSPLRESRARAASCGAGTVVLLGIGGSALGARTLAEALAVGEGRELIIIDNIDPHRIEAVAAQLDYSNTEFVAISKSGSTAETIAQLLFFRSRQQTAGIADWRKRWTIITDPERGPLREVASREQLATLAVPPAVGGRFSVLTAVGLYPAALLGIDIEALIGGARAVRTSLAASLAGDSPAAAHPLVEWVACQSALHFERGLSIQVLLSYCDRLRTFGLWFAQLWAESLGKRHARDGRVVEHGSTPLAAVGATDQHSLVQLFAEGPRDKQFLVLSADDLEAAAAIPASDEPLHDSFGYLTGRSIGELRAEKEGTVAALRAAGRPLVELRLARLDAAHLGALFFFFEVATALAGDLYQVDPYDQPGVEAGKILAFDRMGRDGYAAAARKILEGGATFDDAFVQVAT